MSKDEETIGKNQIAHYTGPNAALARLRELRTEAALRVWIPGSAVVAWLDELIALLEGKK